jgi:hypothetical protein
MTKHSAIFDWVKSEGSRKDKLYSVIIVGLLFAFVLGTITLTMPSPRKAKDEQGAVIRFVDQEMAKAWALVAEENGPFPGRKGVEEKQEGLVFEGDERFEWGRGYKPSLRPMREELSVLSVKMAPGGKREFPVIPASGAKTPVDAPKAASVPILVPYDAVAVPWLPESLPSFDLPVATDQVADALRFLVNLREDGSVAELIALAGVENPAQEALDTWLRAIRFKQGEGDRWFGLQIDFVNGRENESKSN